MRSIDKINFREIEQGIEQRNSKIPALKLELLDYITVDDNLNVIVAEEHKEKALMIRSVINKIPSKNAMEKELMKKARQLAKVHGLVIDRSGHPREKPEVLNLGKIESDTRIDLMKYQFQKKAAIARSHETPKEQLASYGCLQPDIPIEPIEEGIAECTRRLKAVENIRKELEPLYEGE